MSNDDKSRKVSEGKNNEEYKVGPGRPPKESQFRPSVSGNPGGRPKKRNKNQLADSAIKVFDQKVPVTEGSKKRMVPLIEAVFISLAKSALTGNLKAIIKLLEFYIENCAVAEQVERDDKAAAERVRAKIEKLAEQMRIVKMMQEEAEASEKKSGT